jgi:uncharacterized protein (DUF427 family)
MENAKGSSMWPERIEPGPGQESVWDYPRPPRVESTPKRVEVVFKGVVIADTTRSWRVLETSHPPIYYIPREDVRSEHLVDSPRRSFCEWKGRARYVDVRVRGALAEAAGWYYPEPTLRFDPIRDCVAFYPAAMDACKVDGEIVRPQPGHFYGGWITSDVVGPFKGVVGSDFW